MARPPSDQRAMHSRSSIPISTHPFSPALKKRLRAQANESFTNHFEIAESELPAPPEGWQYQFFTAIALKLKGYCDPHDDTYLGEGDEEVHRSVFWLLSDTSKRPSYLIANGTSVRMSPDSWAFFDDSQMHAFLADGTWIGLAIQLTRKR